MLLHFTAGGHLDHDLLPLPNLFCLVLAPSISDNGSVFNVGPGNLFLNSVLDLYYGLAWEGLGAGILAVLSLVVLLNLVVLRCTVCLYRDWSTSIFISMYYSAGDWELFVLGARACVCVVCGGVCVCVCVCVYYTCIYVYKGRPRLKGLQNFIFLLLKWTMLCTTFKGQRKGGKWLYRKKPVDILCIREIVYT